MIQKRKTEEKRTISFLFSSRTIKFLLSNPSKAEVESVKWYQKREEKRNEVFIFSSRMIQPNFFSPIIKNASTPIIFLFSHRQKACQDYLAQTEKGNPIPSSKDFPPNFGEWGSEWDQRGKGIFHLRAAL